MRLDRCKLAVSMVRRDLKNKDLAVLSGLSAQTISNIKRGKSCTDAAGNRIADALNISIDNLVEAFNLDDQEKGAR